MREVFVFMALPEESQVEIVRVSACSVVGGAKRPLIAREMTLFAGIAVVKREETVMMWVEYCPLHCMVELLICEVSP